MLGINFREPLAHLREYVLILKALLQDGSVDYSGRYYQAHTSFPFQVDVPVMAAASGEGAFEMCGAEADGDNQLGMSRGLPAGCCPPGHKAWGRTSKSPCSSLDSPCACVRPRRPRGSTGSHRGTVQRIFQAALLPEHVSQCRISRSNRGRMEPRNGGRRGGVWGRGEGDGGAASTAGYGHGRSHGLYGGGRV